MTLTILNVIYVCVAIAMVVLILLQRGAGAQAGSGFGAGASATVFGSRGASSFLTKATKWLAVCFFLLSLGIGMFITHRMVGQPTAELGVMQGAAAPATVDVPAAGDLPAAPAPAAPAANSDVPAAPPADPVPAEQPKSEGNG